MCYARMVYCGILYLGLVNTLHLSMLMLIFNVILSIYIYIYI